MTEAEIQTTGTTEAELPNGTIVEFPAWHQSSCRR